MLRAGLVSCAAAMLVACGSVFGGGDEVQVRLENASSVSFEVATLFTSDGPHTSRDLQPGQATAYVAVSRAYRFATTEVVIPGDTLRLQVIDFVGEQPLDPGRYTYRLLVSDLGSPNPSLVQQLRRDR